MFLSFFLGEKKTCHVEPGLLDEVVLELLLVLEGDRVSVTVGDLQ